MNGNGAPVHPPSGFLSSQVQVAGQGGMNRPGIDAPVPPGQPVLYLLSMNGTFERKCIAVPFIPDTMRIGRQTNNKTIPTPSNAYFDSKVLSRQHAEIWADRQGKIWIRDIKSSNGTFVNGTRLSAENRESEPHELQTNDLLELGIDIVSEDQKSIVHHKVSAKVEHAGIMSNSNNLLDMSFGELDPANSMVSSQLNGLPPRGRPNGPPMAPNAGRMPPAANVPNQANGMMMQPRGVWLNQPSTEAIVKRLTQEMRNARLQAKELERTQSFINALLSKDDLKNEQKPEAPDPPKHHMVNGGGLPFRTDPKTRFSDPPAPPPQQPLPEKPDVARPHGNEVPPLKRGITERPKNGSMNTSPIRESDRAQIIKLTEDLSILQKDNSSQQLRIKDLEEMLQKERELRESAEEQNRRLEDAVTASRMNGSAVIKDEAVLEQAFEPPQDASLPPAVEKTDESDAVQTLPTQVENVEARLESMVAEMKDLKQHLEEYRQRAEKAEAERDADRETLAQMVEKVRKRDEEEAILAKQKARSRSRGRKSRSPVASDRGVDALIPDAGSDSTPVRRSIDENSSDERPTLSRTNTITPASEALRNHQAGDPALQTLPYASMIGVVLLGMGLMAYLNGWQPPQSRLDR